MEKRKEYIIVEDFEDKKYGKGKRYTRFKTDQGWISSFHKPTIEKLKNSIDKKVKVEIETDDDDREKITKILGAATDDDDEVFDDDDEVFDDDDDTEKPVKHERPGAAPARKSVKGSAYEKDPVGLAVEVFVAIQATAHASDDLQADMIAATNLVKQAQKVFNSK